MENILKALKTLSEGYRRDPTLPSWIEQSFFMSKNVNLTSATFVPHEDQYHEVGNKLGPSEIVIDMGSGDLRFPLMVASKVKKIYAVELNPELIRIALGVVGFHLPPNMVVICADWFDIPIPNDVTTITCLCNDPEIPPSWFGYKVILGGNEIQTFSPKPVGSFPQ